jgi:hypothetical protein
MNKKKSESQAALEMCKILFKKGFLDSYLRPYILKSPEPLNPSGCSTDGESRDENEPISISDKQ